jgi:hypothetical protein
VKLLTVAASVVLACAPAVGFPAPADAPGAAEPQLALQYDFFDVQDGLVPDGSGHGHRGTIVAGTVVSGKRRPAVRLEGSGSVTTGSPRFELAGRPMTVGAMCRPAAADGVVASMGDTSDGFSLYVKDGVPHFAVRSQGTLHDVADSEPLELDQWVHLAGVVGTDGELTLLVNAFPVAKAAAPGSPARTLSGAFVVGSDGASPAGPCASAMHWQGLLEDVRVYAGALSREQHRDLLGDWANRPGCGCRK